MPDACLTSGPVRVRDLRQSLAHDPEVIVGKVVVHRQREDPARQGGGHRRVVVVTP